MIKFLIATLRDASPIYIVPERPGLFLVDKVVSFSLFI